MLNELLQPVIIISILASTIRIATPVLTAALGELVAERAGVLNMGVEGMMLTGAFAGFYVTYLTDNLWLGILGGMLAGAAMSLIMAFMGVSLRLNQTVTGLGINLLAFGLPLLFWLRSRVLRFAGAFLLRFFLLPAALPEDFVFFGPL